jgi:hypothetical protein
MQHGNDIRSIMLDFAAATGLSGNAHELRRYLWTDAFAVCNFLELYRQAGEAIHLETALKLVAQVHFVLGRFSPGDVRHGWISGLDEQSGYEHPTCGGLRIGKKLAERKLDEPFDERLEWDRDGQYFHYLTKWMQALARVSSVTGDGRYLRWALELAKAAHAGFTYEPAVGKTRRMYWKMSVDLSRPLVASMGHHDPLDALLTYIQLRAASVRFHDVLSETDLDIEIADCQSMCAGRNWATDDPLGTGSLLVDAWRLALIRAGSDIAVGVELVSVLADCGAGLEAFEHSGILGFPAVQRLAFREFGLSTGLHALVRLSELSERYPGRFSLPERRQLTRLLKFSYLSGVIEGFWLQSPHQQVASWRNHADINSIMLATSLAPHSYLVACPEEN